jgi:hypothetical protein
MKAAAVVLAVLAAFLAGRFWGTITVIESAWALWREWAYEYAWPVALVLVALLLADAFVPRKKRAAR